MKKLCALLCVLPALGLALPAMACWMGPMDYERRSENGEFMVRVSAPIKKSKTKSRITVLARDGDKWRQVWSVTAINPVEPANAAVSNDGLVVTTVGNWYGKDDGNDEVVMYSQGGVLKNYSVTDLIGTDARPDFVSTAGAEWLSDSFYFYGDGDRFCLWVDFVQKWIFIDTTTGKKVRPGREYIQELTAQVRLEATNEIQAGTSYTTAYRRLARFLKPEDRPLFEELLTKPDEHLSCGTVSGTDGFHYFYSDHRRQLCEMVFQALDSGRSDAIKDFDRRTDYKYLGCVELSATFSRGPRREDGVIVLWLESIEEGEHAEEKRRPVHALGIDLKWHHPASRDDKAKPLSMPVQIVMYGIIPGTYRVRGYWKMNAASTFAIEREYWKQTGDAQVVAGPEIVVTKGQMSEPVKVVFK